MIYYGMFFKYVKILIKSNIKIKEAKILIL